MLAIAFVVGVAVGLHLGLALFLMIFDRWPRRLASKLFNRPTE